MTINAVCGLASRLAPDISSELEPLAVDATGTMVALDWMCVTGPICIGFVGDLLRTSLARRVRWTESDRTRFLKAAFSRPYRVLDLIVGLVVTAVSLIQRHRTHRYSGGWHSLVARSKPDIGRITWS